MKIQDDVAKAAKWWSEDPALLQAVDTAEGGGDALIKAVNCTPGINAKTRDKALEVSCRTLNHARRDFIATHDLEPLFAEFLAKRWAPVGATNDPKGLNRNWLANVWKLWRPTKPSRKARS